MSDRRWNSRPPSDPALERYAADIRRLDRIGEAEELALIAEARQGSLPARDRLIKAHLRFVLKVALHYRNCPVPVPDLVNEGVLGLVRAIESYERTGIKFISYAVWWIRSHMVRAIEDKGAVIRLPANEHARLRRLKRERKPGDGDAPEWVRALSMGAAPGRAEEDWADPAPLPDDFLARKRLEGDIRRLVGGLTGQESFVIRNVYGLDQEAADTLRDIGLELGVSLERVRQIREKALHTLRKAGLPR